MTQRRIEYGTPDQPSSGRTRFIASSPENTRFSYNVGDSTYTVGAAPLLYRYCIR